MANKDALRLAMLIDAPHSSNGNLEAGKPFLV